MNKKSNKLVDNLGSTNDKVRLPAIQFISAKIVKSLKKDKNLYCELNGIIDILKLKYDGSISFPGMKFKNVLQGTYEYILQMFDSVLKSLQQSEIHYYLPMVTRCVVYEMSDEMYKKLLDSIRGCLFYSVNGYFSFVREFTRKNTEGKEPELEEEPEEEEKYFIDYTISNPFIEYTSDEIETIKTKRSREI